MMSTWSPIALVIVLLALAGNSFSQEPSPRDPHQAATAAVVKAEAALEQAKKAEANAKRLDDKEALPIAQQAVALAERALTRAIKARDALSLPVDASVVDARGVPSGLWKGMDEAIASAYGGAPAGVSDRVRKGFQAVMDRDWKVAKAWFEDALNRDPANASLKRLVALVDAPQEPRRRPPGSVVDPTQSLPWPQGSADLLNPDSYWLYRMVPNLKERDEKEMMDLLFPPQVPAPTPPSGDSKPSTDATVPPTSTVALKPNWKALFDALFKNPPKSKYPQVGAVRD